ncbi:long-chain fatty acid--CoA ligase [Amycolatopsis japonica]|uniref:long-chain-fatty-acid--CoA ligase n=1 Tax=Amycolatopsis japonica TaxID=208439 RepID=UPI00366F45C4
MSLSLAAVLADSAGRRPDHPALVFDGEPFSYRELWAGAKRYASALRDQGVAAGDRVVLLLPNTPEFPMVYFGALALGAVVVPVHTLLVAEEIHYILGDCDARVLICGAALLEQGGEAADAAGVEVLTMLEDVDTGRVRLDVLAGAATEIERYEPREPSDLALILYTSGTTGKPKGAMLTHLSIVLNVATTMLSPFDFHADDVLLGCLPLFHTFGQICGMATCFRAGATMVLMSRFDARAALDLMVEQNCSLFMGVPTMYVALLEAAEDEPRRPKLDRAFSGGSSLPVALLERFEAVFDCPIYEGYGLTETSPVVAYNQRAWPTRAGTVGKPIWGVDVAIARAETEDRIDLVPPGEVGEIVIRGHNVMAGYLNRPEATAAAIVDGWFRSGDLGFLDDDGYLSIVDRKKDMILRGGYNVYPREIEEVLARHPAIAQVAVVGVPDDRYGEEICAVVVAASDREPGPELAAELVAWSKKRVAAYKYPRRVEFLDAMPLGPSGKILKRELADRLGH